MPLAVPELIWLALLLFAFAVVYCVRKFIEGLFSPLISALGHIPGVGGLLSGVLRSIEQSISNALGSVENNIDSAIGASFHALAELTNYLWREIRGHAGLLAALASPVGALLLAYKLLKTLVHDLTRGARSVTGRVRTLEREFHGIEHGVRDLSRYVHRVINKDVLPEIRSLDKELTNVEHKVIPNIRSIAQTAENDVSALKKWITANIPLIGTTALVGAVAWALGQLGLGGLRCSTLGNLLKSRGCGLWRDLEGLLGLFADTLLLTNICTLLPILETAVSDVADPLVIALTDVGAGLCSGGIGAPPALTVPALSLPAASGFTLNLP